MRQVRETLQQELLSPPHRRSLFRASSGAYEARPAPRVPAPSPTLSRTQHVRERPPGWWPGPFWSGAPGPPAGRFRIAPVQPAPGPPADPSRRSHSHPSPAASQPNPRGRGDPDEKGPPRHRTGEPSDRIPPPCRPQPARMWHNIGPRRSRGEELPPPPESNP